MSRELKYFEIIRMFEYYLCASYSHIDWSSVPFWLWLFLNQPNQGELSEQKAVPLVSLVFKSHSTLTRSFFPPHFVPLLITKSAGTLCVLVVAKGTSLSSKLFGFLSKGQWLVWLNNTFHANNVLKRVFPSSGFQPCFSVDVEQKKHPVASKWHVLKV